MGEAGPEAIMPLTRGADGRLGVQANGGGGTSIVMNISTPDVEGFRRSQSQIAAQMSRALGRSQRSR
jgi:phage-related minor tail protein